MGILDSWCVDSVRKGAWDIRGEGTDRFCAVTEYGAVIRS